MSAIIPEPAPRALRDDLDVRDFPGLVALMAYYQVGITGRPLGEGSSREAWRTRDGRVLKIPAKHGHGARFAARDQMESELRWGGRRLSWSGIEVARCEPVEILGEPCLIMEYVHPLGWNDSHIPPGYRELSPAAVRYFGDMGRYMGAPAVRDGQWGVTPDGRIVCFDAGLA
jgi:hypothetical protein